MNKKTLATLGLATGMALSRAPKAQAGITIQTEGAKKNLVETMVDKQTSVEDESKIISFNEAKEVYEQQKLFEEVMKNEDVQKLVEKYGKQRVEKLVKQKISEESVQEMFKMIKKAVVESNQKEKGEDYMIYIAAGIMCVLLLPRITVGLRVLKENISDFISNL